MTETFEIGFYEFIRSELGGLNRVLISVLSSLRHGQINVFPSLKHGQTSVYQNPKQEQISVLIKWTRGSTSLKRMLVCGSISSKKKCDGRVELPLAELSPLSWQLFLLSLGLRASFE